MYLRQQNKCYPQAIYLPISKLLSILTVANLLAHNNISQICYCGQISLQRTAVNCSFSDNLTPLGGNIYFAGNGTSVHKSPNRLLLSVIPIIKICPPFNCMAYYEKNISIHKLCIHPYISTRDPSI